MEFSEGYLTESYEKALGDGLKAKDRGNLALAKKKFAEASEALTKLAFISEGTVKEERLARAEKLKQISNAIKVDAKPQARGGVNNSSSVLYTAADISDADVSQFMTLLTPDDLKFGFEGVMGLDEAKDAITEYVINPIKYPDAYNYEFMDNNAILLYGPPGTGKTTFAKAVAKEVGQPFFLINMSGLVNCYVGETAKNIDKIFDYMRSYVETNGSGIIAFFDEFDEISKKRGGDDKTSESAVPALLRNLDGVKQNKGFTVLANTNCKDMLDDAIVSRFRRRVYIPLPDKTTRGKLFEKSLKDLEKEYFDKLDMEAISTKSEGLSGRDIAYLCDDFKRVVSKYKAGLSGEIDLNDWLISQILARIK